MAEVNFNKRFEFENILKVNSDVTSYFECIFKSIDTNKDEVISVAELKEFLDCNECINLPEKIVECVYKRYDVNKDEQMDLEEFMKMVNDPDFKSAFHNVTDRVLKFIIPTSNKGHIKLELQRTLTVTGAYEKESKCTLDLLVMVGITLIQLILFYTNRAFPHTSDSNGPITDVLAFDPNNRSQVYRYITYMFVHSSEEHLYGNLVVQLIIGIPLQMVHGWRVLPIYFSGVVGGCLCQSVSRTNGLNGASAGVFAFYTAHIAAVIMNWREMSHPAIHLFIFGVIVSIDGVYRVFMSEMDKTNHIGHYAHGGGALVGFLLGVIILKNIKKSKREHIFWYACSIILGLLTLTLILLDICLPPTSK